MQIISHRGYWKEQREKNQAVAFERSFASGFGTETDIRDYNGQLVISHDIADENALAMHEMLAILCRHNKNLPLALNIKADGLQSKLKQVLAEYEIENYFVFDMSIPDGLQYLRNKFTVFTRQSEYETVPSYYSDAAGVWLDEFYENWISQNIIEEHKKNKKRICIVSPELHRREHRAEWERYKEIEKKTGINNLMICTDYPEEAREFFDV